MSDSDMKLEEIKAQIDKIGINIDEKFKNEVFKYANFSVGKLILNISFYLILYGWNLVYIARNLVQNPLNPIFNFLAILLMILFPIIIADKALRGIFFYRKAFILIRGRKRMLNREYYENFIIIIFIIFFNSFDLLVKLPFNVLWIGLIINMLMQLVLFSLFSFDVYIFDFKIYGKLLINLRSFIFDLTNRNISRAIKIIDSFDDLLNRKGLRIRNKDDLKIEISHSILKGEFFFKRHKKAFKKILNATANKEKFEQVTIGEIKKMRIEGIYISFLDFYEAKERIKNIYEILIHFQTFFKTKIEVTSDLTRGEKVSKYQPYATLIIVFSSSLAIIVSMITIGKFLGIFG